jgi:hypothetical protein
MAAVNLVVNWLSAILAGVPLVVIICVARRKEGVEEVLVFSVIYRIVRLLDMVHRVFRCLVNEVGSGRSRVNIALPAGRIKVVTLEIAARPRRRNGSVGRFAHPRGKRRLATIPVAVRPTKFLVSLVTKKLVAGQLKN